MAEIKSVSQRYVTGRGELCGFISLIKPNTKFNAQGIYTTGFLLSHEEGEALYNKLKDIRTEQYKKYGKGTKVAELGCKPYEIINKETGESTSDPAGRYILTAKAKAFITNEKPNFKPLILNAKKQPVNNISIGEGTIARLALTLSGYSVAGKTGVSIKLGMVQIIQLKEYQGSGFSTDVFEEEEGFDDIGESFEAEEAKPEAVDDAEEDF